ncbi:DUF3592 domain-containing protein [Flavobacterium sp. LS1R49]|uniref:DUF3592 domain-containing protein n=1 Tax=Flavobacterium shii TaxID=2987687 RepID=A0A9X3C4R6_9FLAO|nr:DUF3592 domain-containing protein [Flavobacterium shii]MCV9928664.1 DUF3592 domain-containing protein [Flavobacterium shii]
MLYKISLAIGILLSLVSLFILKESLTFIKKSERAEGTVIGFEEISGDGGSSYSPIFKIKTKDNQEITYTHTSSTSPPSWDIGEKATFLYKSNDPDSARILTYFGVFSWSIVLMGIAIPLIVIGSSYHFLKAYLRKL